MNSFFVRENADERTGFDIVEATICDQIFDIFSRFKTILDFIKDDQRAGFRGLAHQEEEFLKEIVQIPHPLGSEQGFELFGGDFEIDIYKIFICSVAWRFVDFNPALLRVQTYVGGGVTWNYATRPLDKKTAQTAFDAVYGSMDPAIAADEKAQAKAMQNALESAYGDLDSGFGGHVLLGARVKLLVFSVYVNGKYHFGGLPSGIDNGLTLELGGGLGL